MERVDVRWRPSGGRGEYEHVPSQVLLERQVLVDPLVVPGLKIETDVWGRIKDGKPRLRREKPNDRSVLNLPQLVSALAWLPDSIREDSGELILPLKHKQYVIRSIEFSVDISVAGKAFCTPQIMRILHYSGEIDLVDRLGRINRIVNAVLPDNLRPHVERYLQLVSLGSATSEFRVVVDRILETVRVDSILSEMLDAPSDSFSIYDKEPVEVPAKFDILGVDETRRKLSTHYKIDRSRKIRAAKIEEFSESYGVIFCENCEFDFSKKYGDRGEGFIEVHHKVPLAGLLPNTITYLSDLVLLCSNCHRMIHRKRPDLNLDELKAITR